MNYETKIIMVFDFIVKTIMLMLLIGVLSYGIQQYVLKNSKSQRNLHYNELNTNDLKNW